MEAKLVKRISVRDRSVQRVILIEGIANLLVLVIKCVVGFTSGSIAIISDAIHSMTDVANNIVAWVVVKISSAPPDTMHPYGHRKIETLAVFFLATLLTIIGIELLLHVLKSPTTPPTSGMLEVAMMSGVLFINIVLALWQRQKAKQLSSDILMADASHTFCDVLTTLVIIIGWQLSASGIAILDRVCALGVAGIILYLAFNLFKKVTPILIDQVAFNPHLLRTTVLSVPGVLTASRIRSRAIGKDTFVDLIITVDPSMSTEKSHAIADNVEAVINRQFGATDISIHVEPNQIESVWHKPA